VRRNPRIRQVGVFELALALAVPPGVIARADRGSDASAGEQAGDADRGLVEQFDQLADLGGEHRERTEVAAAHPCDRTPCGGAARVDLQAEQQLVFLGDVPGAADQLQVGDKLVRRVLQRRVRPFGLEQVAAKRVRVRRKGPFDP
jgi:hypothetical protein